MNVLKSTCSSKFDTFCVSGEGKSRNTEERQVDKEYN